MTPIHTRQPSAWPDIRPLAADLDLATPTGRENLAEAVQRALASGQAILPPQRPNYIIKPATGKPRANHGTHPGGRSKV